MEKLVFPERTAKTRTTPSLTARIVKEKLVSQLKIKKILDWGCGKGRDVQFYQKSGLKTTGFDPHEPFGFAQKPKNKFDLVVVSYVINALPSVQERRRCLKDAAEFGSKMLIVTRSEREVTARANRCGWKKWEDGYWSSETKRTFQKGMTQQEIIKYVPKGFKRSEVQIKVKDATAILIEKQ